MKRSKKHILAIIALTLSLNLFAQDNLFLKIKTGEKTKWLTFSPDGRYLATAKGKKANLWLSGTNTLTKQFRGHKRQITDLCFSPDSKYLITVSKDKTAKIWDIEANKEIKTLQGHLKAVNSVAYSKVGNFLTTASNDKTVKIWDFETGSEKQSYSEHLKKVKCVAISPDGRYVASAGGDIQQTANKKILERNSRIVIIREVNTGKIIRKIAAHKKLIRTLTFSPDGKYLASGGDDKTIKIWSMEDTTESKILSGQSHPKHAHLHRSVSKSKAHKGWIFDLEYSPDGKFLASASGDMSAIIWEAETGVLYLNFHKKHRNSISSLSFSPDGKYLATTEIEGKYTKLWDVSSLNIVPIYQFKDEKDNTPPQIYVSNPPNIQNNRIIISRDLIDVRGTVIDESGLRNLFINGKKVPVKKNGNFVIFIPLTPGVNRVKIEAVDVNDNIAGRWFDVIRKDIEEEKYDAQKARNYLFVVGINDYQYWPKLFNAVSDAEDVASTLTKMYRFDSSNTIVLLDSNATRN
ncbi:MAG: WD40 repeat domain-containing protein, partial [Bacteroidetes bacterium]|nr:WD40 repeat domain-containing protein [Bacteroidota bacterium]